MSHKSHIWHNAVLNVWSLHTPACLFLSHYPLLGVSLATTYVIYQAAARGEDSAPHTQGFFLPLHPHELWKHVFSVPPSLPYQRWAEGCCQAQGFREKTSTLMQARAEMLHYIYINLRSNAAQAAETGP